MPSFNYNFDAINEAFATSKIAILDSMPGSGKTTAIAEYLKAEDQQFNRNVLFVTPFRSEAEHELPANKLTGCNYRFPTDGQGGKVRQLQRMLKDSIVPELGVIDGSRFTATHYCFTSLDSDAYECLAGYTLIIDEALDVAGVFEGVGHYTTKLLEAHGDYDSDTGQFKFNEESWFVSALRDDIVQGVWNKDINYHLLKQVSRGMLYVQNSGGQLYAFRVLPPEIISKAARVIVMTHNFQYSAMECWMRHHNLDYSYINNELLGLKSEGEIKDALTSNIKLIPLTGRLRGLLRPATQASKELYTLGQNSWSQLMSSDDSLDFGNSLKNMVRQKLTMNQNELFWTVPKAHKSFVYKLNSVFKGKPGNAEQIEFDDGYSPELEGYAYENDNSRNTNLVSFTDSYLPSNIKAINGYGHVGNCLYGVNLRYQPNFKNLLIKMYTRSSLTAVTDSQPSIRDMPLGTLIDDTFAFNSLIQFIHRGSIRNGEELKLMVLSYRIEVLLKSFLPNLQYTS